MFLVSTMQDFPLTITAILRHGAEVYGDSECVTWTGASAPPRHYRRRSPPTPSGSPPR